MADETTTRRPTATQREVLAALGDFGAGTPAEVASYCDNPGATDWARQRLRACAHYGWADKIGPSYSITDAGRRALSDAGEGQ